MNIKATDNFLKTMFALALIFVLYAISTSEGVNPEAYTHALYGKEIFKDVDIPKTDKFSFTGDRQWDKTQWIFDIFAYSSAATAGFDRLGYFRLFGLTLLFFSLFLVIVRRLVGRYVSTAMPFMLAAGWLLTDIIRINPQLFTSVFMAYFLYVLERRPSKRNMNLYISLPFITLLWSNIDNTAVLAPVVCLIYLSYRAFDKYEHAGAEADTDSGADMAAPAKYDFRLFALCAIGSVLAVFLNPSFIQGLTGFITGITASKPFAGYSATSASDLVLYTYALVVLAVIAVSLYGSNAGRKAELVKDLVMLAIFTALAAYDRGLLNFFLIVSFPILAYYFSVFFRWSIVWPNKWAEKDYFLVKSPLYTFLILLLLVFGGLKMVLKQQPHYPSGAVNFLSAGRINGNVFHPEAWGGYMAYYLAPGKQVMMLPGKRADKTVREDYRDIMRSKPGAAEDAARYGITAYALPAGSGALKGLPANYALAYFDAHDAVYADMKKEQNYLKYITAAQGPDFYMKGKLKEAVKEMEEFSTRFPSEAAYNRLAVLYGLTGKRKAIEFLNDTLNDYPEYDSLYELMGRFQFETGEYAAAIDALESAGKLTPAGRKLLNDARKRGR